MTSPSPGSDPRMAGGLCNGWRWSKLQPEYIALLRTGEQTCDDPDFLRKYDAWRRARGAVCLVNPFVGKKMADVGFGFYNWATKQKRRSALLQQFIDDYEDYLARNAETETPTGGCLSAPPDTQGAMVTQPPAKKPAVANGMPTTSVEQYEGRLTLTPPKQSCIESGMPPTTVEKYGGPLTLTPPIESCIESGTLPKDVLGDHVAPPTTHKRKLAQV